jgi:hypothetical protein
MTTRTKIVIVLGGYSSAVVLSLLTGLAYNASLATKPYDTSGGMYAGGEALQSAGVFLLAALVPTLLGLWWVRRNERVWNVVSVAAVVFAALGMVTVLRPLFMRGEYRSLWWLFAEPLWLAQLLGVPLWAVAFGLFAAMAPTPRAKRLMLVALGLELGVAVFAAIHWFVPRPPL